MPFSLKTETNKDGTRLIFWHFNFKTREVKISTGLTIHTEDWDFTKQKPKRSFKYYTRYTRILDRYARLSEETYLDMIADGVVPTHDEFKQELLNRINPGQPLTVWQHAMKFAEAKERLDTRQAFIRVANAIKDFNPRLTFDKIDMGTMADFKDYLLKEVGYGQNTAATMFKRFKAGLNDAVERGLTSNIKFKTKRVAIKTVETTKIFLDEKELGQMYKAELPEHLVKHRDLFLILAYTGVRFSDLYKITRTSFKKDGINYYFQIRDEKTGAAANIPAHPMVLDILKKYEWHLPKVSNPELNIAIKEVGRLAKIEQELIKTTFPGGKRKDEVKLKYEMIESHTGRRSLVCNLLLANYTDDFIAPITGHTKGSRALANYKRLTPSNMLQVAFKSGFFSKAKLKVI